MSADDQLQPENHFISLFFDDAKPDSSIRNDAASRRAGRIFNILGPKKITDDHDASGSGGEDFWEVGALDAADAEGGDSRPNAALHFRDVGQANAGTAGLGGSGEKRAEADVIEAFRKGSLGLGEGMGGAAEKNWG